MKEKVRMNKTRTIICSSLMSTFTMLSAFSQKVYNVPFAGNDNKIELTVSNTSAVPAKGINVTVGSCPSWIKMKIMETAIGEIEAGKGITFTFSFDVDKTAPTGEEGSIDFIITSSTMETETKEINIKSSAPDKYELYQNYPNPFNPATTISYQLPQDGRTTIKIYDILGREVMTLVDKDQSAGYFETKFNANTLSSGVYIYRMTARSKNSANEFNSIKKMLLIK